MKYSELNFPALSDFEKKHNYMIIRSVIHFVYFGNLTSPHSQMLNMLARWDKAKKQTLCVYGIVLRGLCQSLLLFLMMLIYAGSFTKPDTVGLHEHTEGQD